MEPGCQVMIAAGPSGIAGTRCHNLGSRIGVVAKWLIRQSFCYQSNEQ
ncbi:hypothetical protein RESH_05990 [Rhodopirellula europaea SH398]|uniref:Uncharacterized protein n=1 Tax=Rhodopirellula europaea SH398 TaxID=1263868 RepID=M5S752_9BACT|nr:hypothetical protein RESH_05990 [Rhodopirellula europaea SH398]